jgi:hypothetical protein
MKMKICPKCGTHNAVDAWNCQNPSCGELLPMSTVVETSPAKPAVPEGYRPEPLATSGPAFRFTLFGSGTVPFVLSLIAMAVGLGYLGHGVASGTSEGVIRVAHIYTGLGVLMVALLLAVWCVAELLASLSRQWRMLNRVEDR